MCTHFFFWFLIFLNNFLNIYLFLERREGREKEKETSLGRLCTPPTRDPAHNPAMCPDWESNPRPLSLQGNAQPTEPHQSGIFFLSFFRFIYFFLERGVNIQCERETPKGSLPHTLLSGTKPATQACALTRNRTSNVSFCGTMPNRDSPVRACTHIFPFKN